MTLDNRVYYVALDATKLIRPGLQNVHVPGVQLGNGWFYYQTMHVTERWLGANSITYVPRALSDHGRPDIVETMVFQATLPAYWTLVVNGQTPPLPPGELGLCSPESWSGSARPSLASRLHPASQSAWARTQAGET